MENRPFSRKNCNFFCKLTAFWGVDELPQSKPDGFASSLWEGANPLRLTAFASSPEGGAFCPLPISRAKPPPFGGGGIAQR